MPTETHQYGIKDFSGLIPINENLLIKKRKKDNQKHKSIQVQVQKTRCSLGTGSRICSKEAPPPEKKNKKRSHAAHLKDHSGLLQQVGPHVAADDAVPLVKADLNVLSETAAVVIAGGFSIPDGLCGKDKGVQDSVGFPKFQD